MPRVALAGVGTGFSLLPTGQAGAVFTKYTNGTARTTKNPKVNLEFTFKEGEALGDESVGGRKAFINFTFTENSLWAFKKGLIQLGITPDDPRLEDPEGIDSDEVLSEVMGAEVIIAVGLRDGDDGKTYNNFEIVDDLSW